MSKQAKITIELIYDKSMWEARDVDVESMTEGEFEEFVYDTAEEDLHYLLREERLVHWSELKITEIEEEKEDN